MHPSIVSVDFSGTQKANAERKIVNSLFLDWCRDYCCTRAVVFFYRNGCLVVRSFPRTGSNRWPDVVVRVVRFDLVSERCCCRIECLVPFDLFPRGCCERGESKVRSDIFAGRCGAPNVQFDLLADQWNASNVRFGLVADQWNASNVRFDLDDGRKRRTLLAIKMKAWRGGRSACYVTQWLI